MAPKITEIRALAQGLEQLAVWLRRELPSPLSSSTLTALDRLHREGPLRVSDLAVREAMTQPGVTLLVTRLADAGYAERVPDPTDRRATLVRITPAGSALLAERRDQRAAMLRARMGRLSADEQQRLVAALPAIERLVAAPDPTNQPAAAQASADVTAVQEFSR